jgi:hypothetical protein
MPDGDAREGRLARPDHRHAGRVQMHDVAQGWHAVGAMGVIGRDTMVAVVVLS